MRRISTPVRGLPIFVLGAMFVTVPFFVSAQSIADLQAQIQSLMVRMAALRTAQEVPGSKNQGAFSAPGCPALGRNLARGARGTDVAALQAMLIRYGMLEVGNVSGYFGGLTEAAVKIFQCRHLQMCTGSPQSNGYGSVGPKTRASIMQVCTSPASSASAATALPPSSAPSLSVGTSTVPAYAQAAYTGRMNQSSSGAGQGAQTAYAQGGYTQTAPSSSASSSQSAPPAYAQGSYVTTPPYSQSSYYSQASYAPAAPDVFADTYACGTKQLAGTQQSLLTIFDAHMTDLGDAYSLESNRQAVLGNNEPSYLDALLDAYVATNNVKYLQRFVIHADRVLGHRDDAAGYTDYRGRSGATWSDGRYSTGGQYASYLVEDGALIASLAHFAAIVNKASCLKDVKDGRNRSFGSIASSYVVAAGETVNFHMENWHTGDIAGTPIGYYTTPTDATFLHPEVAGRPVPVNYQSAMGTALAYLYGATSNASYLGYAQRLGNFVLLEMANNYHAAADAYTWPAWPHMTYWEGAGWTTYPSQEDLSHSIVTAEFARAMREQGLGVFYETEMRRLAHVYSRLVYNAGAPTFYIDGTGGGSGSQAYQFARAAMLAPYNPSLWSLAYDVAVTRLQTDRLGNLGSIGAFTGLARLLRYYPQ